MGTMTAEGKLAQEASIERRIEELLSRLVATGWNDELRREYQEIVSLRASTMKTRVGTIRRRGRLAAAA